MIKNIDVVMTVYNLIEYSVSYSKTSGSLWRYYRDKSALTNDGIIKDFHAGDNNSALFKLKQKITGVTTAGDKKEVEIVVPLNI